ncbi:hypothetical protein KRR40_37860 [Niabella defluvii]|nr:hypothetical protein KRR40_37860 [Niabella sp. I65]
MLEPASIARFSKGWQPMATHQNPGLKKFEGWFADVFTASAPGASFSFRFSGDMVGVFDIGGPEVGQLEWIIDGKPVQLKEISRAVLFITGLKLPTRSAPHL